MQCFVYASQRKTDTYLWLARRDDFAIVPATLTTMLGQLRFVLEVQLDPERKLPQEDARAVLDHLSTQGWHLQVPPPQSLTSANHLPYNEAPQDLSDEAGKR
ncbi:MULTISPECIES: YcgL domain-containing protein [Dyella]|uniref:YcgL domain-containing protein EZM97_26800 n=2 Tax=Dyella TaxID=231454 RepID=A0A4R0YII5_9GAMM|nr:MULTISPECIES: YcgL domain-containing protein [Dyella]TBR36657.1 YcgL domain-containing protein [Dyella terrae]TCI08252.1 YcgL domain-containing protein [Dyella soli]